MNQTRTAISMRGLKQTYSPVRASKINTPADSRANGVVTDKHQVELIQEVTIEYPKVKGNALYSSEELSEGQRGGVFPQMRYVWLTVPADAVLEEIQERLDAMESPTLYAILDLKPILTSDQARSIETGFNPKSFPEYMEDFIPDENGNPRLFNNYKQYRKVYFREVHQTDIDLRYRTLNELRDERAKTPVQVASERVAEPTAQTVREGATII